jgi:hypothetical protein
MNRTNRAALIVAASLGLMAIGFSAGRIAPGEPAAEPRAAARAPEHGEAAVVPTAPLEPPVDSAEALRAEGRADPSAEAVEHDAAIDAAIDFGPALAAAREAADMPDDEAAAHEARAAAEDLHLQLAADPTALAQALERFRRSSVEAELGFLAAILGQIADPEVEAFAVGVASGDASTARRAAALEILDAFDTPLATPVALAVLAAETDLTVRRAALHAIPDPTGLSLTEAAAVARGVSAVVASDPDPEARRRAVILAGRYGSDMGPVLTALARDPEPSVRAGAAFALEVAGRRSPAVFDALIATLASQGEDPLVQENAWRALGALSPLPEGAHRAYGVYAEARVARMEAQ